MAKLLQNRIAESRLSLPITTLYATAVWLLCGAIQGQWWLQFACFATCVYLISQLNSVNSLIRVYSRMVSCSFLVLSCMHCDLFPSTIGAVTSLLVILTYLLLFMSYQDKEAKGKIFYAFLSVGLASLAYVHLLYFVPVFWVLMGTKLMSLSWRTWGSSLLGLLTPYWFMACWLFYNGQITSLPEHFQPLAVFQPLCDWSVLTDSQIHILVFLILLMLTGAIHFVRKNYYDNIRTRMYYGLFIWVDLVTIAFLLLQPQHHDILIRIMIINTAPLIGHFIALTSTKFTNVVFCIFCSLAVVLTVYNLWITSFLF